MRALPIGVPKLMVSTMASGNVAAYAGPTDITMMHAVADIAGLAVMRDFAGMGGWHEEITKMHMLKKARSGKVGGIRDFYFGDGHLNEELLHLCDITRSFSYRITKCGIAWINYVSGPRLWPVTADNSTFGMWTGDWNASPQDDLVLIPRTEENVYQRALATLEKNLKVNKTDRQ